MSVCKPLFLPDKMLTPSYDYAIIDMLPILFFPKICKIHLHKVRASLKAEQLMKSKNLSLTSNSFANLMVVASCSLEYLASSTIIERN